MSSGKASAMGKSSVLYVGFLALLINQLTQAPLVAAGKDKGDDIILAKGKIILRGGKGKGNIILDPGHSSESGHHEMPPMMSMMGHFNPYAFYPMQQQHHQPQVMIRPIYIEDHSAMHHMPQQHHEEHHEHQHHEPQMHHEHQEYHHEEPHHQHHYEPQHHEMEHQQEHHEQPHYEGGEEHHHEGYESHQGHPLMSLMSMHGSGPQPIYQANQPQQQQQQQQQQQMAAMQAYQQPAMYAQLSPEQQQQMAYQQAQYLAAEQEAALRHQQQPQEAQQSQSSEVSSNSQKGASSDSSSSSTAPSKPVSKVTALLEKSANNPLIQRIKPLFKRNKDQKDSSQKKP